MRLDRLMHAAVLSVALRGLLAASAGAVVLGAITCGCPRPRDCAPSTQRCERDTPVVCSSEGRSWLASGEPRVTCAQVGGECVVRDGRAFCARRTDGGAP